MVEAILESASALRALDDQAKARGWDQRKLSSDEVVEMAERVSYVDGVPHVEGTLVKLYLAYRAISRIRGSVLEAAYEAQLTG